MDLEKYVESLPQDQLPPDGKIHPTRKKLPPTDAVKYIPKERTVGGLVNYDEECEKKKRQAMEAKLAVSETNNDVSDSKLSRRSKADNEKKMDEKRKEKEMIENGESRKSDPKKSQSSSTGEKDKKKKSEVTEEDKYKGELEKRMEKKTVIDKVTFFDKETKRDDIQEPSQDEKMGLVGDSMKRKLIIGLGILFVIILIALIVVVILLATKKT